jgi:hypothetical protein
MTSALSASLLGSGGRAPSGVQNKAPGQGALPPEADDTLQIIK